MSQRARTETDPDHECMKFMATGYKTTFEKFENVTNNIAANFLASGLSPGDRIGIWSPNHLEWMETQFAAAKAGLILVNVNPSYTAKELQYVLKKCGIKAIVTDTKHGYQDYEGILKKCLAENLDHPLEQVIWRADNSVTLDGSVRELHFDKFRAEPDTNYQAMVEDIIAKANTDDPVNIQFTSGTTGNPKGALLSHHGILNNALQITSDERFRLGKDDNILVNVPLYHCFGCVAGSLAMITRGAKMVFPAPSFNPEKALDAVRNENTNIWYGTPTMYVDMLAHPSRANQTFDKPNYGLMAGAMCPEQLLLDLKKELNCEVFVAYGTTENSPVTTLSTQSDSLNQKTTTVGAVMPHTECKIIDTASGGIVERGETGEVCIRGTCVFLGYWDEPEKTAEVVDDNNWYHTGDLGIMRSDGYIQIVGRSKDMIIRGGENIYPAEIEATLVKHPKIVDAHVIGVESKRLGEEVAAYIRLEEGSGLSEEDIREYCRESLAYYKIPKFIKFVDSYPLTVTGKIQKFQLRSQSKDDFELDI